MSRRNAPSLLSISARPVALGGTLRSPVRARIPISAASVAATPHSQKRREHEKWAKHRSTISGAPNGHRAFQKRHASSPLGPQTSPERGGELWGPRASGGSDGKISSEFGLIRTWTRDCMRRRRPAPPPPDPLPPHTTPLAKGLDPAPVARGFNIQRAAER